MFYSISVIALGFFLDLILGDPLWLPHPVRLIGKLISWLEKPLRAVFPKSKKGAYTACLLYTSLLDGKKVGFICDFPIDGSLPKGLCEDASLSLGICVTLDEKKKPFKNTLVLIPQSITVGIGCRKGASKEAIQTQLSACLAKEHISPLAIKEIASINIKAQEAGLLALCKEYDVPLKTYSASQLMEAKGTFSCSSFVKEQTGTDNVCERAALLASGGSLLVKKQCGKGVTIALAAANWP